MQLRTGPADSYEDVAVVMITRNEERAIRVVIDDAMKALPGAEVFVIDGSDDRTPEIAREAGATVIREPGGGFGPALHAALMAPDRPIVVTVDADDTYPAAAFPTLVRLIREGWDVAGTDRLGRWPRAMPWANWVANHAFSGLASLRALRRLRDVHSGQRAYRADVLRSFEWDYRGLAFPVDLLLWPALERLKVVEVPIPYTERIGETKLRRWASGKATLRRLLRRRAMVKRRLQEEEVGPPPPTGRPVATAWPYNNPVRERIHTAAAALLSRSRRPLWYAEMLVLSARYQQFLASAGWARDSVRYGERTALWEKAAEPLLRDARPAVLEFGVADGRATRWWLGRGVPFAAWHGFDTFEGLPADWVRGGVPVMAAGVFKPTAGTGAVPRLEAPFPLEWHRGLIEETLPGLSRPDTSLFVLVDVDLLEPASVILDWLASHGRPGDLVYFDEAFDPWNEGLAIRRAVAGGLALRAIAHTGSALLVRLV